MYWITFFISLLFSLKTSLIYNNFTFLSYQKDTRIYYLIWITFICIFLLIKTIKLLSYLYLKKIDFILLFITLFTMLIGAYLPYRIQSNDIFSNLHVIMSSCGSLFYLVVIQLLINRLMSYDFDFYIQINSIYHRFIILFLMLIVMFGMINGLIELFCLFIILYILNKIESHLKKELIN